MFYQLKWNVYIKDEFLVIENFAYNVQLIPNYTKSNPYQIN